MSRVPGFVGPSSQLYSRNANNERTVNLIVEPRDAGTPPQEWVSYSRPGLKPWLALPAGPVRGLFQIQGRAFGVGGGNFVELLANGTGIVRGGVLVDGNPVTMSSNGTNGHQVFITSGGSGYIFDLITNTLTRLVVSGFPDPCLMGDFVDSYFVALKGQSNQWHLSAQFNGLIWDPLDVAQISTFSTPVVAINVSHREVWSWGTEQTEPWNDIGQVNFPYAPVPGVQVQMGNAAPWAAVRCDNTLFFVGQNNDGQGMVWRMNGYTPVRISTFALENVLRSLPRIDDAIGWTFQDQGHLFYVLYLPQNDTTWVYDVSSKAWVEWAQWNPDLVRWEPFLGRCHCFAFGKHLVGSRSNSVVYEMSQEYYHDEVT